MAATNTIPVPQAILSTLVCSKCTHYLSVGPIFSTAAGLLCGRCSNPAPSDAVRSAAYESLAQIVTFPCKFEKLGCKHFCSIVDMLDHEKLCTFQTIKCPSGLECESDQIMLQDILDHFNKFHKHLVFDCNDFQLLTDTDRSTCLLTFKSRAFILLTEKINDLELGIGLISAQVTDSSEFISSLKVSCVDSPNCLTIEGPDIADFLKNDIRNYGAELVIIDLKAIRSTLKSQHLSFAFDFVSLSEPKNSSDLYDETLLGHVKCGVCFEIMIPPIYNCSTGHSVCGQCKEQLDQCPVCKAGYVGGRNYIVEKIVEKYNFPCPNNGLGCPFKGLPDSVAVHKKRCTYVRIACPHSVCTWEGTFKDAIDKHFTGDHFDFTRNPLKSNYYEWTAVDGKIFEQIIVQDGELFKIKLEIEYRRLVYYYCASVMHKNFNNRVEPLYKFFIFFDTVNYTADRSHCYWGQCYDIKDKSKSEIEIQRDIITDLLINSQFKVGLQLKKIKK